MDLINLEAHVFKGLAKVELTPNRPKQSNHHGDKPKNDCNIYWDKRIDDPTRNSTEKNWEDTIPQKANALEKGSVI